MKSPPKQALHLWYHVVFTVIFQVLGNIVLLYKQLSICISDEDRKRTKD